MAKFPHDGICLSVLAVASLSLLADVWSTGTSVAEETASARHCCRRNPGCQYGCLAVRNCRRASRLASKVRGGPGVAGAAIEGTWVVISIEMGGKTLGQGSPLVGERWTFAGGCLTVPRSGVQPGRFSYTLDRAKAPAEIDLKKLDSPEVPPAGWIGIYRIDGDTLTICAFPDIMEKMPRPRDFQTEKDNLQVLWKMKLAVVAKWGQTKANKGDAHQIQARQER